MRGPSSAKTLGSTTTAATAEATVTIIPARPIEEIAVIGKSKQAAQRRRSPSRR